MKFLAILTSLFLFLSPVTAVVAEETVTEPGIETTTETTETTEETPTEELVPGFTEEEIDQLINDKLLEFVDDSLTLVAGTWESFLTILGVSSLTGVIILVRFILKRFGLYNGLLKDNEKVINVLTREVDSERKELQEVRKSFMALVTLLNVDPTVKTTLIDKLNDGSTVEEFAEVAKQVKVNQDTENIEEVASLLEQVTKVK